MNTYKIAPSAEHRGDTFLIVEIDDDGIEHDEETRFVTLEAARDAIDRRMEQNLAPGHRSPVLISTD